MDKTVEELSRAIETIRSREKTYGHVPDKFGRVMSEIYPNGILLSSEDDFRRYSLYSFIISKMLRYAGATKEQGHYDSAFDIMGYAAMLASHTDEK